MSNVAQAQIVKQIKRNPLEQIQLLAMALYGITEKLSVSASYRYDVNNNFDNASSYRLGITYAVNSDWRVFLSQGSAIKNPTFTERFGFFPDTFLGKPRVKPEQQKSIEAGINGQFDSISLQISWFDATLQNEILGFVFDADVGQFTARNAQQESTRQGIELSINGELGKVYWQAQYSYLDAKEEGDEEIRRAKHTGSASLNYRLNQQHQLYLQADYSGSKLDRFFPPFPQASQLVGLRPYWLISANYIYAYSEQIQTKLRLSNVTDAKYEDVLGYSGDNRRILFSIEYSW